MYIRDIRSGLIDQLGAHFTPPPIQPFNDMAEQIDPLSEFTIALPTEAQSKLVSQAAHVAFGRGQTFEVCLISAISQS